MLEKVTPDIDFADSMIIGHFFSVKDDKLNIRVFLWNEEIIEINFHSPIFFILYDYDSLGIIKIRKNTMITTDFSNALLRKYGKIPAAHPYQLFQFVDPKGNADVEVICKKMNILN